MVRSLRSRLRTARESSAGLRWLVVWRTIVLGLAFIVPAIVLQFVLIWFKVGIEDRAYICGISLNYILLMVTALERFASLLLSICFSFDFIDVRFVFVFDWRWCCCAMDSCIRED